MNLKSKGKFTIPDEMWEKFTIPEEIRNVKFTIQFLTGKFRIPEEMSGKFEISEKHSEIFLIHKINPSKISLIIKLTILNSNTRKYNCALQKYFKEYLSCKTFCLPVSPNLCIVL